MTSRVAAAVGSASNRVEVADVRERAPDGWDRLTVEPPGGHVLQSVAWAEHRRRQGWAPHFVTFSDGWGALVLTHVQPPLPGFVAYAPRGPIAAGDEPVNVAERAVALGEWCRRERGTILAVDPELDASSAYDDALAAAGFRPTEEIQPSRHRLVLELPPGSAAETAREAATFARLSKSTRQRIRAAEEAGTDVLEDAAGKHLEQFGGLMDRTAERKGFSFGSDRGFVYWWRTVLHSGHARFFVVLQKGVLVGGLLAYVQGGHYATAFSADRADLRERYPGTMHLLRWTLIREALRAGVPTVDLGGVDVPGHRGKPVEGEPGWGMYQHKASFGARWVESAAAHELVIRPWVYRAGLVARAGKRTLTGVRRLAAQRPTP